MALNWFPQPAARRRDRRPPGTGGTRGPGIGGPPDLARRTSARAADRVGAAGAAGPRDCRCGRGSAQPRAGTSSRRTFWEDPGGKRVAGAQRGCHRLACCLIPADESYSLVGASAQARLKCKPYEPGCACNGMFQPPTLVASPRMAMSAATASRASGPAAETVMCWPLVAPRPMTPSTLLASAVLPSAVTDTAEANRPAATASAPAGRACRSPARTMARSQLADMTRLLSRGGDRLEVSAGRGGDRGGHRTLDERRVREQHAPGLAVVLQHRPHRQYRAAQVGQHDHAGAVLGLADAAGHLGRTRAQVAVVGAARRDDRHGAAADLRGQVRGPAGEFGAVRDEDDSDDAGAHGLGSHGLS